MVRSIFFHSPQFWLIADLVQEPGRGTPDPDPDPWVLSAALWVISMTTFVKTVLVHIMLNLT